VNACVVHASAVAFGPEGGVLIEGPSGSGKSTLALALIEQGADLVADDRTVLMAQDDALFARCPPPIRGLIEVRGLGILRLSARRLACIRLVIDLSDPAGGTRLPPHRTCQRLNRTLPWIAARPGAALARGLAQLLRGGSGPDDTLPLARHPA
jgi:HPr kinase/phosphorylase